MKIKANMSRSIRETPELQAEKKKNKNQAGAWQDLSKNEKDHYLYLWAKSSCGFEGPYN